MINVHFSLRLLITITLNKCHRSLICPKTYYYFKLSRCSIYMHIYKKFCYKVISHVFPFQIVCGYIDILTILLIVLQGLCCWSHLETLQYFMSVSETVRTSLFTKSFIIQNGVSIIIQDKWDSGIFRIFGIQAAPHTCMLIVFKYHNTLIVSQSKIIWTVRQGTLILYSQELREFTFNNC